jgi:hypothetical protein
MFTPLDVGPVGSCDANIHDFGAFFSSVLYVFGYRSKSEIPFDGCDEVMPTTKSRCVSVEVRVNLSLTRGRLKRRLMRCG